MQLVSNVPASMRSLSNCTSVLKVGQAVGCVLTGLLSLTSFAQEPGLLTGLDIPTDTVTLPSGPTSNDPDRRSCQAQHEFGPTNFSATSNAIGSPNAASTNQTRVVLLRNDRCLTGRVRQLGDQVVIEIDSSARDCQTRQ